mmetsp:Transcript_33626/g.78775  ORF Transcript_33626/g.78775 Transcript_33626/m.78775 type:complete len:113 (+) Transcript_33626:53-391(+)
MHVSKMKTKIFKFGVNFFQPRVLAQCVWVLAVTEYIHQNQLFWRDQFDHPVVESFKSARERNTVHGLHGLEDLIGLSFPSATQARVEQQGWMVVVHAHRSLFVMFDPRICPR